MEKKQIELLAPAGSYEGFLAALKAGADGVYAGGDLFGARANAQNFTTEQLIKAIDLAHLTGKKLYLTVNTLIKDRELDMLDSFLTPFYERGLDAVIVQDIGVLIHIRERFPDLSIHCSTQMTLTGVEGAKYMKELGAKRMVTSREISLWEIKEIHEQVPIEIESFIHGALCYSYSGQCLMSGMIGGRSGNRGRCAQTCRLPCDVEKKGKTINGKEEKYILSLKDICTIDLLPQFIQAGVSSLKMEGRMKKPEYTYGVTKIYRHYLDKYLEQGDEHYRVEKKDRDLLLNLYTRSGLSTGYYMERNGREMVTLTSPGYTTDKENSFQKVQEEWKKEEEKQGVKGWFLGKHFHHMELKVQLGEIEVCAKGDFVEEAKNHPVDKEGVRRQLEKTGGTPYFFETLEISLENRSFFSLKSLNALRRQAFSLLEEKALSCYFRKAKEIYKKEEKEKRRKTFGNRTIPIHIQLRKEEHLKALIEEEGIHGLYLEGDFLLQKGEKWMSIQVDRIHQREKKVYFVLPSIFRKDTKDMLEKDYAYLFSMDFDGMIVKNYEEIQWLKDMGYKKEKVADHNLYSYNHLSSNWWKKEGMAYDTVPFELNFKECMERGVENSEMVVYGYVPLMISAQCVHKSLGKCTKVQEELFLTDRMHKKFLVQNHCLFCYNVIYNSVPLSLHGEWKDIKKLSPKSIRLQMTMESVKEVLEIVRYYKEFGQKGKETSCPVISYTKGHFRRGVQ